MANANLHSNSSIFNNKGYKETQTMNDTDKKLDKIIKILLESADDFYHKGAGNIFEDAENAKKDIRVIIDEAYKKGYIDRGIRIN